jgi:hypothetical protein
MLVIFTTTIIRVKNKYNANIIVIMFVGKLYNLINGILVELLII